MIKTIDELDDVCIKILKLIPDGGIVLLEGDLASGKTTLVKNFVKLLGIEEEATSPTFSILNIYNDSVYHYDIYNEGSSKFLESGLMENLEFDGFHLIEWADERLEKLLIDISFDYVKVEIKVNAEDKNKREYKVKWCIN
jgi:tRNA threonylcarbamoyladenosine biosynthesis protein TsaE